VVGGQGLALPRGLEPCRLCVPLELLSLRLDDSLTVRARTSSAVLLDLATSPPPDFVPLRPALTTRKSSYAQASADLDAVDTASPLPYRRRSSAVPAMLLKNDNAHRGVDRRPQTTVLTQIEVLAKREARNFVRDRGALVRLPFSLFRARRRAHRP